MTNNYITQKEMEEQREKIFASFLSELTGCKEEEIKKEVKIWVKDCVEAILKQYGYSIPSEKKEHPCLQADHCNNFKNNTCTLLETGKCNQRKENL